jgi:hypothetical protein
MPDLVRRAATAVKALRPDYFEGRRRLVPELAQLIGPQRSRIDADRLAVLIHFLARPKWTPWCRLVAAFRGSTLDRDGRWRAAVQCPLGSDAGKYRATRLSSLNGPAPRLERASL